MKNLKQTYHIKASSKKVWDALINSKTIDMWGGGPAHMSDKDGAAFKLWGGDIHGKNTKVIHEKRLEQDWYGGDWAEASQVSFNLRPDGENTEVTLIHENIPDEEFKDIEQGWKDYYMGPLKKLLEEN